MAPPTPMEDPKVLSFEAHLEALEAVVGDLEGDALSLEASIARYQEGVRHLSSCRRILDAAERRLTELVATADGGAASETPLEVGPDGLVDAGRTPTASTLPGAASPCASPVAALPPPPSPAPPPPPSPPSVAPRSPQRPVARPQRKAPPLPPPSSEPGDDLPF